MHRRWVDPSQRIETLFPGYFALVMATGIVAIAASQQDLDWLADVLFVVAVVAYVVLAVLLVARLVRYPRALVADLTSHAKGFAFLTVVAATNVVGSGAAVIHGWWDLAWALWYVSLAAVGRARLHDADRRRDRSRQAGARRRHQRHLVPADRLDRIGRRARRPAARSRREATRLAFVCLAAFTLGLVLYLIVMTMVFLRWTFQPLEPTEADPPAWIAAGAVAITVLAGSNLLLAAETFDRVDRLAPFLEGCVVLAWATATFWFPVMVAIGVWRHIVRRMPLRYHPSYWAMVFPLGMYGAATYRMRAAIELEALRVAPQGRAGDRPVGMDDDVPRARSRGLASRAPRRR